MDVAAITAMQCVWGTTASGMPAGFSRNENLSLQANSIMNVGFARLEPISESRIKDLGSLASLLQGLTVYGLLRRCELESEVLNKMNTREKTDWLRVLKSRRWILPDGFPQLGWHWEAVVDFGRYKSQWNGKHDLDGGHQCDICHNWSRYIHIVSHPDWDTHPLVGGDCAIMLSDIDPGWAEKKLALAVAKAEQKCLEQQLLRERERQEAKEIALAMLRSYGLPEKTASLSESSPNRAITLQPDSQLYSTIDRALDHWQRHWREDWFPARANPQHSIKRVSCPYVDVTCVLFIQDNRYRYVLYMPDTKQFSTLGYPRAYQAHAAAFAQLHDMVLERLNHDPAWFLRYKAEKEATSRR